MAILKDAARNFRFQVEGTAAETATRLFAQFMPYQSPPRGVVQLVGDVIERARYSRPGAVPSRIPVAAVDRFLIGPDGEVAPWIGRLRAKPMSVVLLDEFEKSSPEVHDCLLSALDEGRLTDRFGRTTTFCGAIMILTSNVGSRSTIRCLEHAPCNEPLSERSLPRLRGVCSQAAAMLNRSRSIWPN